MLKYSLCNWRCAPILKQIADQTDLMYLWPFKILETVYTYRHACMQGISAIEMSIQTSKIIFSAYRFH
jgi:hypothetical protein